MERAQYLSIRNKLDLSHRQTAVLAFAVQNLGFVGAIALFWQLGGTMAIISVPLTSALIFRHFSMMHEAVHKAASKTGWINDLAGIVSGGICWLPYEPWKKSHLEHHMWSGNIDKDPVTALITNFPKMKPQTQNMLSFFWNHWFPMLACMQYSVFYWLASKIYLKNPRSIQMLISIMSPLVIWTACVLLVSSAFTFQVLLPAVFLYLVAVEVVNFPHHLQLPQYRGETKLAIWNQHEIARSCLYPRWFARLIVLNFNYHIEHHMFPDVPWYRLESLHLEIKDLLASEYNSDPYFNWILENKPRPIGDVLKAPDEPSAEKRAA